MARIKPLETDSLGRGGNADVIPAELAPAEPAEPSRSADVQHVAVKKLRLDGDTDDTRVLAVSVDRFCALTLVFQHAGLT